jgi:hypothetical protein
LEVGAFYKPTRRFSMRNKECYEKLYQCALCLEEFESGDKAVSIYKSKDCEFWVHAGMCFEQYKQLLIFPGVKERGIIIGICNVCFKPIREKDSYEVGRVQSIEEKDSNNIFERWHTTYPSNAGDAMYHKDCSDVGIQETVQDPPMKFKITITADAVNTDITVHDEDLALVRELDGPIEKIFKKYGCRLLEIAVK